MDPTRRSLLASAGLALAVAGTHAAPTVAAATPYQPQTRTMPIAMLPLLTHEFAALLPYLKDDFAGGGQLDGKEVYGFYPSHVTAYAGDTITFTIINPADDPHTMTFVGLNQSVEVKGKQSATLTLEKVAEGIYTFLCAQAEHAPWMWGQLVVLPAPS
jgi:plastocyanin